MEIETILWYAQGAFNVLVAVVFLLHQRRVHQDARKRLLIDRFKKEVLGGAQ